MTLIDRKNFDKPDEVRPFEGKGRAEVVFVGDRTIGKGVFEPGWRWSVNVKPIAGTDSCQVSHLTHVVEGRMRVTMTDGTEIELHPGDIAAIPPGHDAEVLGDTACIAYDFGEFGDYAKR
ncbi:cupin domain-containing protein [Longispora albida]|uniref:cupin domain-containing protein n=1 Tax=Longispora albida TaxID=203523 RepID=UPI000370160A|nr:cupin domain-containing protein [Longispora albida]